MTAVPRALTTIAVGSFHHLVLPLAPQEDGKICPLHFPFFFLFFIKRTVQKARTPKSRRGFVLLTKAVIPSLLKPHHKGLVTVERVPLSS